MTKKKLVSLFTAAVLTIGATATLTACGDPEVTGIEITTAPDKVHYVAGQTFDPTGMVVTKLYDNDTTEAIPATEYTLTPSTTTALKVSDKKVTVKWTSETNVEYTCTQNITVTNDLERVEIVSNPEKTEYIAGELFDPKGMQIEAFLENGDSEGVVDVNPISVVYKTGGLVKSDEHFEMSYGGVSFYLDITVLHGAFVEAEAGQMRNGSVNIADAGPDTSAITLDYENAYGNLGDNQPHRGIDEGKRCIRDLGNTSCESIYSNEYDATLGCKLSGPRVDVRYYVYNHLEWTETTGGTPAGSKMMQRNHVNFKNGGQMFYRLTADKAGTVTFKFKIANPNISGSVATETKLSEVLKLNVGGKDVTIPDTAKLEAVDWSGYKAYNKDADYAVKGDSDKYTGSLCKPVFYWQDVSVDIAVEEGINDIIVESIWNGDVKLDSITCNGDADEIMLNMNTQFKPEVVSGQLKVEDNKVLLGMIVDAQAANYNDDEVKGFLALTRINNVGNTTYFNSGEGNSIEGDRTAPWTTSKADGGLGYDANPKSFTSGTKPAPVYNSVEKITEGEFAGCYTVWYDITCQNDNYEGVFKLAGLNYGTEYENGSWCRNDVLWDGNDDVSNNPLFAEHGGYCYQVYSDTRMEYGSFTINGKTLMIVIQKGSYTGDNPVAKLCRKYIAGRPDNDKWLHAE